MPRKKKINLMEWVEWLVSLIVTFGIGGLFWNGTMTAVPVLSWLPLIVHQVVAGIVWLGVVLTLFKKFMK